MPKIRELDNVEADYPFNGPMRGQLRQVVSAPAEVLFRCLADGPAWKKWLGLDVEWTSPEPFGVGATRTVTGRGQTIEEYFFTWEEGRRMGFRFERATMPFAAFAEDYLCEPRDTDSSELVWSYAYEWSGPLPKIAGRLFGVVFAFNGKRALKKLARLIEEDGSRWA